MTQATKVEYLHKDKAGFILGTYRATQMKSAQATVTLIDEAFVVAVINLLPGERVFCNAPVGE